ncbi:MAG: AraC family transcriptional regulator [Smithella sp.]
MQPTPNAITNVQHKTRLRRILAYIRDHYADEMNMAELAKRAGFSEFHFQRVFREAFNETIHDHIRRIRLEKAACRFISGENASITEIAYACGFSSSQHFTKAFKRHFGMTPSLVRKTSYPGNLAIKKMHNWKSSYGMKYLLPREVRSDGMFIKIPVWTESGNDSLQELEVMDMPSFRVAYVRTIAYPGTEPLFTAMNRLIMWAMPKGLFTGGSLLLGTVGFIRDADGRITYEASITVPEGIDADEDNGIRIQYLPEGEYGVFHGKFQTIKEINEAWNRLISSWWISSYFPRECRPLYEIYYNNCDMHPNKTWIIDICLPITTLHKK